MQLYDLVEKIKWKKCLNLNSTPKNFKNVSFIKSGDSFFHSVYFDEKNKEIGIVLKSEGSFFLPGKITYSSFGNSFLPIYRNGNLITQEIKTSPETKGIKDSIARKMAATRRNPILAAQQLEKTVDMLTQEFAEVRTVRRSDVEHFVRNHGVKNAKKEVLDYIDRVAKMSELYADSTVVDLHIIMAICRRSKQPSPQIILTF
jgi:hypothetical protein